MESRAAHSDDLSKRAAARAALEYVEIGQVLGVGTGSTVAHFIEELGESAVRPAAAVATSRDTAERLARAKITVVDLAEASRPLYLYVDGADEVDCIGRAIKGGGGAHVREKAVARASRVWVCIVDGNKVVERIGSHAPVPLEVGRDALDDVMVAVEALGGEPRLRVGSPAESGNLLVDVYRLVLADPMAVEDALESIPGVVGSGLFAHRTADIVIVGGDDSTLEVVETG